MHTEQTARAGTEARPDGTPPLTAVVPLAPKAAGDHASASAISLPVVGNAPVGPSVSVHYALDQATHRWVASIIDAGSGEVVCTVPSTQLLHVLASLRQPLRDVRA
jgi:hypothetical protein